MVDHFAKEEIPLTGAQCLISIVTMFLLVILSRLKTKMMDKDDPFSNGYLLAMIIFFVCAQRVLFTLIDYLLVNEAETLM